MMETALIPCFFVSDLHGRIDRYEKIFDLIAQERPAAVFMGGDLLPSALEPHGNFIHDFLAREFAGLRHRLGEEAPRIFVIMGNDDPRSSEAELKAAARTGIWHYIHNRCEPFGEYTVYGYAYVPPTPFMLKDWERYDVGRFVDPGCVSPEEGHLSVPVSRRTRRYATIARDLERLVGKADKAEGPGMDRAVFLFHTPPYRTNLDRIDPASPMIDHVPVDVNVGSTAVRSFIEARQPLLTLHGHIHESWRRTGSWRDRIGRTHCFSAAHGGPELSLVRFDLEDLAAAARELV
jgi:Icc-related predicted phosphoesterase